MDKLFLLFFKIGAVSIGGGYVMLPLIFQGIQKFGIMSENKFADLVAISQITPGPIAINAATYVGYEEAGILGAIVASIGVILPCFFISLMAIKFLVKYQESVLIERVFEKVRVGAVAMILSAGIFIANTSMFTVPLFSLKFIENAPSSVHPYQIAIFTATCLLTIKFKAGPILVTFVMAGVGALVVLIGAAGC